MDAELLIHCKLAWGGNSSLRERKQTKKLLFSFFFDLSLFTFSKHDSKARDIITFAKFKRKIQLLFSGMHDKK